MTIDHATRDFFSRPYAASSDEGDRGETGSDRPAIAVTIVAASRPRAGNGNFGRAADRWRLLAEAAASLRNPLPPSRVAGSCDAGGAYRVHSRGVSGATADSASLAFALVETSGILNYDAGEIEQLSFIQIFLLNVYSKSDTRSRSCSSLNFTKYTKHISDLFALTITMRLRMPTEHLIINYFII